MDEETNVGLIDRLIRVVLGLGVLAAAELLAVSVFVQAMMIVIGAVVLVTGGVGFCLLYKILGVSTYKTRY